MQTQFTPSISNTLLNQVWHLPNAYQCLDEDTQPEEFIFLLETSTSNETKTYYIFQQKGNNTEKYLSLIIVSQNKAEIKGCPMGKISLSIEPVELLEGTGREICSVDDTFYDIGLLAAGYWSFLQTNPNIDVKEYLESPYFQYDLAYYTPTVINPVMDNASVKIRKDEIIEISEIQRIFNMECQFLPAYRQAIIENSFNLTVEDIERLLCYEFTVESDNHRYHYYSFTENLLDGFVIVYDHEDDLNIEEIVRSNEIDDFGLTFLMNDNVLELSTIIKAFDIYQLEEDANFNIVSFLKKSLCLEYLATAYLIGY